jgi:hypothetical protein
MVTVTVTVLEPNWTVAFPPIVVNLMCFVFLLRLVGIPLSFLTFTYTERGKVYFWESVRKGRDGGVETEAPTKTFD